jgi:hypothetical protein
MSNLSSFAPCGNILLDIYKKKPDYFVRLIEFILLRKRNPVRFYLSDTQWCDLRISGILTTTNREYNTIHDWYNDILHTNYPMEHTAIFEEIYVSSRMTLDFVVRMMATRKDIAEFNDTAYKSYRLYKHIHNALRAMKYLRRWNSGASYHMLWNGRNYVVSITSTHSDGGEDILDAFDRGELTNLYYIPPNSSTLVHIPTVNEPLMPTPPTSPLMPTPTHMPTPLLDPVPTPSTPSTPVPSLQLTSPVSSDSSAPSVNTQVTHVSVDVKDVINAIIATGIFPPTNAVLDMEARLAALEAKLVQQDTYIKQQSTLIAQHETYIRHIESYLAYR